MSKPGLSNCLKDGGNVGPHEGRLRKTGMGYSCRIYLTCQCMWQVVANRGAFWAPSVLLSLMIRLPRSGTRVRERLVFTGVDRGREIPTSTLIY